MLKAGAGMTYFRIQNHLKRLTLVCFFCFLISCGDDSSIAPYYPVIGESAETVLSRMGPPYFMYEGPNEGVIMGYVHNRKSGQFTGFQITSAVAEKAGGGPSVVILYLVEGTVFQMIEMDGHISDELLDGGAFEVFERSSSLYRKNQ